MVPEALTISMLPPWPSWMDSQSTSTPITASAPTCCASTTPSPLPPSLLLAPGASRSLPCAHLLMSLKPAIRSLKTLALTTASPATNPTYLLTYLSSMSVVVVNMAPHLGRLLTSFWCEMWELLVIASVTPSRLGRTSFLPSSPSQHLGDGAQVSAQVSAQHAPSYPSTEARLPSTAALAQVSPTLHHADASLYSRSVAHPPPKPPLSLVLLALFAFLARLGQAHPIDASLLALPLVVGRVYSPVRCHQPWRFPESPPVMLEGRQ